MGIKWIVGLCVSLRVYPLLCVGFQGQTKRKAEIPPIFGGGGGGRGGGRPSTRVHTCPHATGHPPPPPPWSSAHCPANLASVEFTEKATGPVIIGRAWLTPGFFSTPAYGNRGAIELIGGTGWPNLVEPKMNFNPQLMKIKQGGNRGGGRWFLAPPKVV